MVTFDTMMLWMHLWARMVRVTQLCDRNVFDSTRAKLNMSFPLPENQNRKQVKNKAIVWHKDQERDVQGQDADSGDDTASIVSADE